MTEAQQQLLAKVSEREEWLVEVVNATRDREAGTHTRTCATRAMSTQLSGYVLPMLCCCFSCSTTLVVDTHD